MNTEPTDRCGRKKTAAFKNTTFLKGERNRITFLCEGDITELGFIMVT